MFVLQTVQLHKPGEPGETGHIEFTIATRRKVEIEPEPEPTPPPTPPRQVTPIPTPEPTPEPVFLLG